MAHSPFIVVGAILDVVVVEEELRRDDAYGNKEQRMSRKAKAEHTGDVEFLPLANVFQMIGSLRAGMKKRVKLGGTAKYCNCKNSIRVCVCIYMTLYWFSFYGFYGSSAADNERANFKIMRR